MSRRSGLARALVVLAPVLCARGVRAQCHQWSGVFAGGGELDGDVRALAVFDDGSGPALYAGGSFTHASGAPAQHLARWNGASWSAVGGGVAGTSAYVSALHVFDDGSGPALYVGGSFTSAGPLATSGIARWDGASWSSVGGGVAGGVASFAVWDDGGGPALYVGGAFATAGGTSVHNVAKWDGANWSALGAGTFGGGLGWGPYVLALAVHDDGTGAALYAGGGFSSPASEVAKWNGVAWSALGGGVTGAGGVYALASYDDGSGPALYVGGNIGNGAGSGLLRWNGASWSATGLESPVFALATFDDGTGLALHVGGMFSSAGGVPAANVARWNGAWSALDGGVNDRVYAVAADGARLAVGGAFTTAGGIPPRFVAAWDPCTSGSIVSFCSGDESDGVHFCPCANGGQPGRGCDNSSATGGALLGASGTTNPDTIVLAVGAEKPNALSIVLQGDAVTPYVSFGDGLLCTGGHLVRLYLAQASGGALQVPGPGDPSVSARSAARGDPLTPLATRAYQVYYRDPASFGCAPTFNVSNGVRITW